MFHVNDRIRFRNPIPDLTLQVGVDEAARYGRLAAVIGDEVGTVIDSGQSFRTASDEDVPQCSVLFVDLYGGEVPSAPEALFELVEAAPVES